MTLLEFMNVLNTRGIGLQARDGKLIHPCAGFSLMTPEQQPM